MRLYKLEMKVLGAEDYTSHGTGRMHWERAVLSKFSLTLEGDYPSDDEGEWSSDDQGRNLLGMRSGYWKTMNEYEGYGKTLLIMNEDDPTWIGFIFGSSRPDHLAYLDGVLKLPLSLGETGTGLLTVKSPGTSLAWRVVDRGF